MSDASDDKVQAAFEAYRNTIESWVHRKPKAIVLQARQRLREKAINGNAHAALELAIIEAAIGV